MGNGDTLWHLCSNIDVAITVDIARRHAAGLGLASRQVHGGLEGVGLIGRAEELVRLPVGCDQEVKAAVIVDIGKDKLVWVVKYLCVIDASGNWRTASPYP